jgi:ClpX C4-type zinc finger/Sigma-70, region 4
MLDPRLCDQARTAAAALAEAERQVLVVRTDYHTAIRRLHLAGASLREIADALSLSHQRVQQIVDGAGGSWWKRVWRTRNVTADLVCTWCDRPSREVSKLIAGPNVFICESCIEAAERAMRGIPGPGLKRAAVGTRRRCAFCRKRSGPRRTVVIGPAADVCEECLRVCRQILDGRAA